MIKLECHVKGSSNFGLPQPTVFDDKGKTDIMEIYISHGDRIHSIQFNYVIDGVKSQRSPINGRQDGRNFSVVQLDYPTEYLTGMSGSANHRWVTALSFTTNLRTYGPYGSPSDHQFSYDIGKFRQFGGFHGRHNDGLASIGLYMKPFTECDRIEKKNRSLVNK